MPLYTIDNFSKDDTAFTAKITFDPGHEVFKGHFPGQPIVPGVFLVQIMKDIAIMISGYEMKLRQGGNIKFLHVIDPRMKVEIQLIGKYDMKEETHLQITANLFSENIVFFKFIGDFLPA